MTVEVNPAAFERLPACPATATIEPGGGLVRCTLLADGHTTHEVVLTWQDGEGLRAEWPEAYDPDEPFDVEVPAAVCEDVAIEGMSTRCTRPPHPESSYHTDGDVYWSDRRPLSD